MSSESLLPTGAHNQTDVYAVHGADPEVLAYAMAKYSRSSLSMRESLAEISAQRAEQFLNTFYFQYGHRSIADLAHIAFAVERLSLLAAIVLVDEQRWDGQERSTRYQNFMKSGWYLPDFGQDAASRSLYIETAEGLFSAYQRTTAAVLDALRQRVARPDSMKPDAYERTLKARALDVARYLLPLATNTSLGQIVNARTLETQVSRLLSHPVAEVRELGRKLRDAATGPAWNVNGAAGAAFVQQLAEAESLSDETRRGTTSVAAQGDGLDETRRGTTSVVPKASGKEEGALAPEPNLSAQADARHETRRGTTLVVPKASEKEEGALAPGANLSAQADARDETRRGTTSVVPKASGKEEGALAPEPNLSAQAANLLTREVRTAPTLVKYAEPNPYLIETRALLEQAARELLRGIPIAPAPVVDLVERSESLEVELAATLIYWACHHPYRQVRDIVAGLSESRINEIVDLGLRHRSRHDEALRPFRAGAALRFDILMDIGGFRDMHRHRRCIQIKQGFTHIHGYETPESGDAAGLAEAGILADYQRTVESAHSAAARVAAGSSPEPAQSALYLLPLATRVRCLFKMDFAEAQYISELRSAPAGHFSYRRVAWEMYVALERQHPSLARHIRATDFNQPIDLLQR